MGKLKEFMTSPKKTAMLGLIGSIMMLACALSFSNILWGIIQNIHIVGLIIYFCIILIRLYKKNGNIKLANYVLVTLYLISLFITIFLQRVEILINILVKGFIILYLCNILFRKLKLINNKLFAMTVLAYSIYTIIFTISYIIQRGNVIMIVWFDLLDIISSIGYMLIIPYFYNYYELLKGENKNGK